MEYDALSNFDRARLETMERGQGKILAALADLTTSLKRMSRGHAEMFESLEQRRMHRDDKGMMSRQSNASRHARPRAEDRGDPHRKYDCRGSRRDETRP